MRSLSCESAERKWTISRLMGTAGQLGQKEKKAESKTDRQNKSAEKNEGHTHRGDGDFASIQKQIDNTKSML